MKESSVLKKEGIHSSLGPFYILPEYKIRYPESVTRALGKLFLEYNRSFLHLIEANREWRTDYQRAMQSKGPVNVAVKIDMMGLSDEFLQAAVKMREEEVRE